MRLPATLRRLFGGAVEERSIDAVPWDVGGPNRPSLVTAEMALGLVPVFACVRLLASQVASLPLHTYRRAGDSRVRIPTGSLFTAPQARGTLYDWLHRLVTSLALRGNAYGLITARDPATQYPTMIEWLHPDDVWVDDSAPSGRGSYAMPVYYWLGREVPTEDIVHIVWFPQPGKVCGLSPISACAATITTGISAQGYTADWFLNGAVPPGKFRNTAKTVNQTEADIISTRLNSAIRRRRPLVYGNDWEYDPIAVASHEAKFVETLKLNATQVAAIFGVPPEMVGGETGSSLTYSTVEQNALNFVKFTLRPWLELLEEAFSQLIPRPQYMRFNVDALLRTDLKARFDAYHLALSDGWMNKDEVRGLEELKPLPNGEGQQYGPPAAPPAPEPAAVDGTRGGQVVLPFVPDSPADLEFWAWIDDHSERHMPGKHDQKDHGHPGDKLGLTKRVSLGPGESVAGSEVFGGKESDFQVAAAAISGGPDGGHMRVGVVAHGDGKRWSAANKGGTAKLSKDEARQLHDGLRTAKAKGHAKAKEVDKNSDDMSLDEIEGVAFQGVVRSPGWGDVHYEVRATSDSPSSYRTTVAVKRRGSPAAVNPHDEGADLTPRELDGLINGLGQMLDLIEAGPEGRYDLTEEVRHMPGKHNQKDHGHPGDQLGLSDRISLGPGESLAGSAAFSGRYSDFEVVVAAVSGGPDGGHVRVGVVVHGDGKKWAAADKGGTAHLDKDSAKQLHEGLKTANAKGKERAAFVDKHRDNMDMNDVDSTAHQGVIKSSWGDVHYQVHATDDEPSSWSTGVRVRPNKAGLDPEEAWFTPGELGKLINGLGQMLDLIQ